MLLLLTLHSILPLSGLANFPFDTITCPIELGGWEWSARYQGLELSEPPVVLAHEVTSGMGYQEVMNEPHTVLSIDPAD